MATGFNVRIVRETKKHPDFDLGAPARRDRVLMAIGRKYFGGLDIGTVVTNVKRANALGNRVIIDMLGEEGNSGGSVRQRMERTLMLGEVVKEHGLDATIATRPGQFRDNSEPTGRAFETMLKVIGSLNGLGVCADIDMERKPVLEPTVAAYMEAVKENPGMNGMALPAYWAEMLWVLGRLIDFSSKTGLRIDLRPVRGVYVRKKDRPDISRISLMHENLARMQQMIATCGVPNVYEHLGSHHPGQVARFILLRKIYGERMSEVEYLHGVYAEKGPMTRVLAENGVRRVSYIPIGPYVYEYGKRRLTETPAAVFGLVAAGTMEGKNAERVRFLLEHCEMDITDVTLPFRLKPGVAPLLAPISYAGAVMPVNNCGKR